MKKSEATTASSSSGSLWRDPQVLGACAVTCLFAIPFVLWLTSGQTSLGATIAISNASTLPLREFIHAATARARLSSSLSTRALSRPIFAKDGGLDFTLCHADLSAKDTASNINTPAKSNIDPFSPEGRNPDLYVANLVATMREGTLASLALSYSPPVPGSTSPPSVQLTSKSYSLLLNKYNTVADHALLVTDAFEPQANPLDRADVVAWYHTVDASNALGLFNSDATAGASQRHKHVQVIPLDSFWPLRPTDAVYPLPLDHMILPGIVAAAIAPPACGSFKTGRYPTHTLAQWPFRHSFAVIAGIGARHEEEREEGRECLYSKVFAAYAAVMADLGVDITSAPASATASPASVGPSSYNIVLTKHYILAVLRSRPAADLSSTSSSSSSSVTVKVNGFGFVGMLLGRDAAAVEDIKRAGPMSVLRQVTVE